MIELLLVLALLAVVVSLGIPSLRKLATKSQLRESARRLRVRLMEARLTAIESERITYFRYQIGGDRYEVGQQDSGPISAGGPAAEASDDDQAGWADTAETESLPLGVSFADPSSAVTPGATVESSIAARGNVDLPSADQAGGSQMGGDTPSNEADWAAPLLFLPNGRTHNARIAMVSPPYRIELRVRGLTGAIQVSAVEFLPTPDAESLVDSVGIDDHPVRDPEDGP